MAGEEEADRLELARQPVGRHPRFGGTEIDRRRRARRAGEEIVLAAGLVLQRSGAGGHDAIDIGERGGAVDAKLVEGAGRSERLERALVDEARIDGAGERRNILEASALLPLGADMVDGLAADIPERRERIADAALSLGMNPASEWLTEGGSMRMPMRRASWAKPLSLSVLPISRVMEAARNSTG